LAGSVVEPLAKAGIVAAVAQTAVTKARATTAKASAVKPTTMKAANASTTVETAAAKTERDDALGPDRETGGDCCTRQQCAGQPLAIPTLPGHRNPPGATWLP
jgi:hypothetical protein